MDLDKGTLEKKIIDMHPELNGVLIEMIHQHYGSLKVNCPWGIVEFTTIK